MQENLFRGPGDLSDLISINIQRGRERGVPSYTTYRNRPECKITPKVKTFDDLKNAGFGQDDINKLRSQYQSVHDIDLFVGGMCAQCNAAIYSCFEKGCRKKSTKLHATRPKGGLGIHYNFAYWPREIYKFVFLKVKNLFFLSGGLFL